MNEESVSQWLNVLRLRIHDQGKLIHDQTKRIDKLEQDYIKLKNSVEVKV